MGIDEKRSPVGNDDAADVDELIRWLEAKPPYEAIGKVVVVSAELELNMIGLALELGIDPKKAWYRDKRAKFLRAKAGIPQDVLDRIETAGANRDLLAHGTWLNLFARGQAFLRPDKGSLGKQLRGRIVKAEELASWHAELVHLNAMIEAERQRRNPPSS